MTMYDKWPQTATETREDNGTVLMLSCVIAIVSPAIASGFFREKNGGTVGQWDSDIRTLG